MKLNPVGVLTSPLAYGRSLMSAQIVEDEMDAPAAPGFENDPSEEIATVLAVL